MPLKIVTICTDDWFSTHLVRWVRQIRMNVPGAKLYLYFMGDGIPLKHQLFREFEMVLMYDRKLFGREWLNTVRMGACHDFGVDEILYLDCDADVMKDIMDIGAKCQQPLGCCRSPAIHSAWAVAMRELGWGLPSEEMNNGLLLMRQDFKDEYKLAWELAKGIKGVPDRIMGTIAFNIMLRNVKWEQVDYLYGVIWHDYMQLPNAKVIQYCNDAGQDKRLRLEENFRAGLI